MIISSSSLDDICEIGSNSLIVSILSSKKLILIGLSDMIEKKSMIEPDILYCPNSSTLDVFDTRMMSANQLVRCSLTV